MQPWISLLYYWSWLGRRVAGLDVSDPGFDINAAIDASGGADPSITETAGTVNNNFVAR